MTYQLLNLFDDSNYLPDYDISCKFILIESLTDHWIVFGPLETYRCHAQLVHRFCTLNHIVCTWIKHPDLVEIHSEGFEIKGGGIVKFESGKGLLEFKGNSTAYGGIDKALLEEFLENCEELNGLEVLVGT
ncbi:MAG: hypothetical protein ACREBV_10060 [Candidatus Zixiibacteriota bacterium]